MDKKIRIAVFAPAEIARRRFMPALAKAEGIEYAGVGVATRAEFDCGPVGSLARGATAAEGELVPGDLALAREMQSEWGGTVWWGYGALLADPSVDAVYLPLPPGLHAAWGSAALRAGKHLLMEKPFTCALADTEGLIALAQKQQRAVHENYMFALHDQIAFARGFVGGGCIGEPRLYRVDFGFPRRQTGDFRYVRALGGGALLDCGGYALKLGAMLAGDGARVTAASMSPDTSSDVDLYGSATIEGASAVAQVSWGMDNDYRCSLDIWGSEGTLRTNRILTAPAGFEPKFEISRNGDAERITGPADDSFAKSIALFCDLVCDPVLRRARAGEIISQARLVEDVRCLAGWES